MRIVYRSMRRTLQDAVIRARERNRQIEAFELDSDEWSDLMSEIGRHLRFGVFAATPEPDHFMGVPIRRAPRHHRGGLT